MLSRPPRTTFRLTIAPPPSRSGVLSGVRGYAAYEGGVVTRSRTRSRLEDSGAPCHAGSALGEHRARALEHPLRRSDVRERDGEEQDASVEDRRHPRLDSLQLQPGDPDRHEEDRDQRPPDVEEAGTNRRAAE